MLATRPVTIAAALSAMLLTSATAVAGTAVNAAPGGTAGRTSPISTIADASAVTGAEESLGYPIESRVLSQDQSQGVDGEGRPQAYWVTAGNDEIPAMFQVTDIRSGEVVFAERLPAGANSWANTFSAADGAVYFGMTSGELYTWSPGDDAVTQLGVPLAGEGIWRLAAAPDGTVYGGTYPGGRLFSYDPDTGAVADHGQAVPGETYVRSIVPDAEHVYVGTQPRARLARMDRATGEFEQLALPPEYDSHEVVYDMTRARDYLFARVQPSNDLIVLDVGTGEVADIVAGISGRAIAPPSPDGGTHVYFRIAAEGIVAYDLDTLTYEPIGWGPNAFPGTWAWIDMNDPDFPGLSLSMTYYYGRIYVWNPQTQNTAYLGEDDLEGAPNLIQKLGTGPDGNIYVGAFLSPPGMARFDPGDDSTTLLAGAGQVEGFGSYGDHLVYGRYPNGGLLDFDTTQPWSMGTNPASQVDLGAEQDRPQALVETPDGRIAVGSVPKSGRLGGALSLWDPRTGDVDVHRDVVPDQSVVSLAERDGLLYGGTSINGGYGIDPVATEGRLFVADAATADVLEVQVPVPGGTSVNALTFDSSGTLWGISDGTLFTFDPATREVTRAEALFGHDTSMYGPDRALEFRDGMLYATANGRLWQVDPQTWQVTELAGDGVGYLAQDPAGNLYYARGAALYRWNFALQPQPDCDVTISDRHDGPLVVDTGTTCLVDADVRGPVQVAPGAVLRADATTVRGSISAVGAGSVNLTDVQLTGPLSVTAAVGGVRLATTTVDGPVRLSGNRGGVELSDVSITGPLACDGNEPAPTATGAVHVQGVASGQCRALTG